MDELKPIEVADAGGLPDVVRAKVRRRRAVHRARAGAGVGVVCVMLGHPRLELRKRVVPQLGVRAVDRRVPHNVGVPRDVHGVVRERVLHRVGVRRVPGHRLRGVPVVRDAVTPGMPGPVMFTTYVMLACSPAK